jgi:hypothetical protein
LRVAFEQVLEGEAEIRRRSGEAELPALQGREGNAQRASELGLGEPEFPPGGDDIVRFEGGN